MAIEYPSLNKIEEYIDDTFKYAKTYYNKIKQVQEVISSNGEESEIKNTIMDIGKEIYNEGGEKHYLIA
jgi:hypothetical protein